MAVEVCWDHEYCIPCGPMYTVAEGEFATSICPEGTRGNTVLITSEDQHLQLCEVEIMGKSKAKPWLHMASCMHCLP